MLLVRVRVRVLGGGFADFKMGLSNGFLEHSFGQAGRFLSHARGPFNHLKASLGSAGQVAVHLAHRSYFA